MKKQIILLCTALAFTMSMANATIHIVDVTVGAFNPYTTDALCGDTVRWNWTSDNASSTSTTVPGGATMWDSGVQSTGFTFDYVVTVEGTYEYHCVNDPYNMLGTIEVTCTNAIAPVNNGYLSVVYPNPCSNYLIIEIPGADVIAFYNVVGEKIKTVSLSNGQTKTEIDVANLPDGIYFYSIIKEGVIIETRIIVKD